jgi:hypothetical protein
VRYGQKDGTIVPYVLMEVYPFSLSESFELKNLFDIDVFVVNSQLTLQLMLVFFFFFKYIFYIVFPFHSSHIDKT